jgi:hypothetical protein
MIANVAYNIVFNTGFFQMLIERGKSAQQHKNLGPTLRFMSPQHIANFV